MFRDVVYRLFDFRINLTEPSLAFFAFLVLALRISERSRVFHNGFWSIIALPVFFGVTLFAIGVCADILYGLQRRIEIRRAWGELLDDLKAVSDWGGCKIETEEVIVVQAWRKFRNALIHVSPPVQTTTDVLFCRARSESASDNTSDTSEIEENVYDNTKPDTENSETDEADADVEAESEEAETETGVETETGMETEEADTDVEAETETGVETDVETEKTDVETGVKEQNASVVFNVNTVEDTIDAYAEYFSSAIEADADDDTDKNDDDDEDEANADADADADADETITEASVDANNSSDVGEIGKAGSDTVNAVGVSVSSQSAKNRKKSKMSKRK
jgi:hypothetical protein